MHRPRDGDERNAHGVLRRGTARRAIRGRADPLLPRPGRLARLGPAKLNVKAVLFDVDFTLAKPRADLGPDGFQRMGREHGLDTARFPEAWAAATESLPRDPELRHDAELWPALSERVFRGMGGEPDLARDLAARMTRSWEDSANFDLYEDALPVLAELRGHHLKLGLVSNTH